MLAACENAVVLRLDAFDGEYPTVGLTTTSPATGLAWDQLRVAEAQLWKELRRRHGDIQYCGFVEWTTGRSERSRGRRLPHVHHVVKGLDRDRADAIAPEVSELWKRYSGGAWRIECRRLYSPVGAIAYLVLHHHKTEQGPPLGTRRVRRLRASRRYFHQPIAQLRAEARELLREERLYAELVSCLELPDRLPSYLVDELVLERIDEARARADYGRPELVFVHEVKRVDADTGEIAYELRKVLGKATRRTRAA